jgi:thiosulfate dehydrogenase [quinone] large subunit
MATKKSQKETIVALLRLSLGWTMLWGFLDKTFGLGFTTLPENAWLAGGSPTTGFLQFATKGPFAELFQGMAGSPVVDWLFMLGLGLIGLALILGIGMKIASYSGALLMILMWTAALPPEHNPFMDEHLIYALLFLGMPLSKAGHIWGLGKWWSKQDLVKKYPFLQ